MFVDDQILNSVCLNVKIAMRAVFASIHAQPIRGDCLKCHMVLSVRCMRVNHMTPEIDMNLVPTYDVI